jgi:hypothetical protein
MLSQCFEDGLEAAIYGLEAAIYGLEAAIYGLEAAIYGLEAAIYGLEALDHLYSQFFKTTVHRLKTAVAVFAESPEFL